MSRHAIPNDALDDRLGFVGTTGSGKTYGAGTAVERILARNGRVVIPDPLGVWWGLRSSADGKKPSPYDVVIFGGERGDLPLNEHAGALIGETVARMKESAIVDLSALGTKAAERRFMLAFLTALYKHTLGDPLHLVFDEADMWAPERLLDKEGEAAKLLGMMETIVRRGRIKGFIPWLISQRPAVLSKNVLSQVDGLVAFKLTSSQDRQALGAWIEGQADREEGKRILGGLPAKQRGEAVVWIPGRSILKDVAFPEKETFDSSSTPKRGDRRRHAELKPVNIDALKEKLATVAAEQKASDPKELRAEITRLKTQLADAATASKLGSALDPHAIDDAERRGFEQAKKRLAAESAKEAKRIVLDALQGLRAIVAPIVEELDRRIAVARRETIEFGKVEYRPPARPVPAPPAIPAAVPVPLSRSCEGGNGTMPRAQRLILTVLAQYPEGRTKSQVAVLTGYAVNGGGFNNALGSLRSAGLIEGGDFIRITQAGIDALGPFDPLPHGDALLQHWLARLGKAEAAALRVIVSAYPDALPKEQVAADAGYEPSGGGFNNALSRLRTLELISGSRELRASDNLFG